MASPRNLSSSSDIVQLPVDGLPLEIWSNEIFPNLGIYSLLAISDALPKADHPFKAALDNAWKRNHSLYFKTADQESNKWLLSQGETWFSIFKNDYFNSELRFHDVKFKTSKLPEIYDCMIRSDYDRLSKLEADWRQVYHALIWMLSEYSAQTKSAISSADPSILKFIFDKLQPFGENGKYLRFQIHNIFKQPFDGLDEEFLSYIKNAMATLLEEAVIARNEVAISYMLSRMDKSDQEHLHLFRLSLTRAIRLGYSDIVELFKKYNFINIESDVVLNALLEFKAYQLLKVNDLAFLSPRATLLFDDKNSFLLFAEYIKANKSIANHTRDFHSRLLRFAANGYHSNLVKALFTGPLINSTMKKEDSFFSIIAPGQAINAVNNIRYLYLLKILFSGNYDLKDAEDILPRFVCRISQLPRNANKECRIHKVVNQILNLINSHSINNETINGLTNLYLSYDNGTPLANISRTYFMPVFRAILSRHKDNFNFGMWNERYNNAERLPYPERMSELLDVISEVTGSNVRSCDRHRHTDANKSTATSSNRPKQSTTLPTASTDATRNPSSFHAGAVSIKSDQDETISSIASAIKRDITSEMFEVPMIPESDKKPSNTTRVQELSGHMDAMKKAISEPSSQNIATLRTHADMMQQDHSPAIRRAGFAMAALGVLLVIGGCLIIAASLAATTTGILAIIGAPGVAAGAQLVTWGIFATTAGISIATAEQPLLGSSVSALHK